jgi:O-glycosyl hydrolase
MLACALVAGAAVVATGVHARAAQATEVTVNLRAARQSIDGFGSSERVWSDPHLGDSGKTFVPRDVQDRILRALYGRLGLTRVRNVLDNGVQKARGAPFDFAGKLADAHVEFVEQARPFGLRTFFPGPVYLEDWMTADDPGAYVDWAMAMLQRWRARGVTPLLYAPLNEPRIARDFPPEWMRQVVIQLGRRLRAAGFPTKLVIPDDENPADAYRRAVAVLEDPDARRYVGAVAFHIYRWGRWDPNDMLRLRRLATRHRLPLWMTEYGSKSYTDWRSSLDWAEKLHVLLAEASVNAVDYIWGFFGDWVRTDTMIAIRFEDGAYRGYEETPIYWITGQYSRFVRPGDVRVAATPATADVLVSAYRGPGRATVVATNPGGRAQTIRVRLAGGKVKPVVRPVRSSASERWRALPPLPLRGGAFTATLPPESVTTFRLRR